MLDHVKFGVSNYAASKAFFLQALEPLGVTVVAEGPPAYGVEFSTPGKASLHLFQTAEKPAHLHLAFRADTRAQVDAFHSAAGGRQGQWGAGPAPPVPRALLCRFRHGPGWAQHRSGVQ